MWFYRHFKPSTPGLFYPLVHPELYLTTGQKAKQWVWQHVIHELTVKAGQNHMNHVHDNPEADLRQMILHLEKAEALSTTAVFCTSLTQLVKHLALLSGMSSDLKFRLIVRKPYDTMT
jgi:hypothetical protein